MIYGLTIRSENVAPVPGRTRGVSVGVPWFALQPSGWWDWAESILAPLDAVIDSLAQHGGWMVFRVICGTSSPAWVTGGAPGADGNVAPAIHLQFRDPHGALHPVVAPLPWAPELRYHYTWMLRQVVQWMTGRTPAGTVRSSVVAFVPVAMPTVEGTEMTLTTQGIAGNVAAWNLAEPDVAKRQQRLLGAWEDAMAAHDLVLGTVGVRSAVALGPLMGDKMAGAHQLVAAAGSWSHCYPMVTNLRVGDDGRTYRSWNASWADLLAAAAKVSATVCQTAGQTDSGGHAGLSPAQLVPAVADAARTYRCCMVETYARAITVQSDGDLAMMERELLANAVTA